MEIIKDIPQGSDEWHRLRLGSIGGSGITKAVAKGSSRIQYARELASEILTGVPAPHFQFKDAERGHIYEPVARNRYAYIRNVEVEQFAMVKDGPHKHHSPDGIVDDDLMVEIKTRLPHVFIEIVETNSKPSTGDRRQIQWGLKRWDKKLCDYIQYCPELEGVCDPMIITRFGRDEKEIEFLESGCDKFIKETLLIVERMKNGKR